MNAPLYTARHGLIWATGGANVRTVSEANEALPILLQMAITERDGDLSEAWIARLGDLVRATREAANQAAEADAATAPQEIAA